MWGGEPGVMDVMKNWAESEKKYYKGEAIGNIKSNQATGHYTQIVWGDTRRMGCARAMCNKKRGTYIWVCNYDPPGNWVGQKPF
jgi:pathogenesis-related protein 1